MSQYFCIHPITPQGHLLNKAAAILRQGGIIVYPSDSGYALGCKIGNKQALERIRFIRRLDKNHLFTLVCQNISALSLYARIDDATFRILKRHTPGPYTFLLPATKEVPQRLHHPNRKIIGARIPENEIAIGLLHALDEPLLSTSLILADRHLPLMQPGAIKDILGKQVELIIDGGYCGQEPSTVVDLSGEKPKVVRVGKGDPEFFL